MRVALISSIVPANEGGGKLLVYRHLKAAAGVDLLVISDGVVPGFNHVVIPHTLPSRVMLRLGRTALARWGNDGREITAPVSAARVAQACRDFKPDLILTVAHGGFSRLALAEARASGRPLVTLFHDWWPDLAETHGWLVPRLDREFRELHRQSAVSLSISEGMLDALGAHPRGEILYPIPNDATHGAGQPAAAPADGPIKIIYMGNLGEYAGMVQQALNVTKDHPSVRLEVRGRNRVWTPEFAAEMKARGLLHDFVPEEQLGEWLATADAFLIPMRFDQASRRYMETSFPSKLTHCVQLGKPLVIWGPEYCSAVRWAKAKGRALCVTDPDPAALMRALTTLTPAERARWAAQSQAAAREEFNPASIQQQFLDALASVCR